MQQPHLASLGHIAGVVVQPQPDEFPWDCPFAVAPIAVRFGQAIVLAVDLAADADLRREESSPYILEDEYDGRAGYGAAKAYFDPARDRLSQVFAPYVAASP